MDSPLSSSSSSSSSSSVSSLPWWAGQGPWQAGGSGAWGPCRTTLITSTPLWCHTLTLILTEVPDAHQVDGHVDGLVVVGGVEHELLAEVEHASALAAHFATLFCTWIWAAHWEMSQSSLYLQLVFSTDNTTQHKSALCTMWPRLQQLRAESKNLKLVLPCFLRWKYIF